MLRLPFCRFLALIACLPLATSCAREPAATVAAVVVPGETLRGNPLGDPTERRAAVLAPAGLKAEEATAMIYYLPGWGGSSEEYLAGGSTGGFAAVLAALQAQGQAARIVVVDGRTRWGGGQFTNSAATGRYADYVSEEVVRVVEARFRAAAGKRFVAGHSSGAYGALLLTMRNPRVFAGVVALSPDSDFEATHRGLVTQANVRRVRQSDVERWMPPATEQPRDGLVRLICGLCAFYAPLGEKQPGRFAWLYDDRGEWQQSTWERWLEADPLTLIRRNRNAFAPSQRIYLDGAERDEFLANIGARNMHAVLKERASPCEFYESPGGHSDHLPERLRRGLRWVLEVERR